MTEPIWFFRLRLTARSMDIIMSKHILSVLVENKPGVLSKVTGLFSRRAFNIDSLAVGTTQDPDVSCITIVTDGDETVVEQLTKQLNKLIDVIKVRELNESVAVGREMCLIKVTADGAGRSEILTLIDIFRASVIDVDHKALVISLTGDRDKIEALTNMLRPYGILEMARTGLIAMQRGSG